MNRKTKIVLSMLAAVLVLGLVVPRFWQIERKHELTLPDDLRTIALFAQDATLRLRTTPELPRNLVLHNANRFGCAVDAQIVLEDDRLEIHLEKGLISFRLWCDPQMTLNLPPDLDLDMGLDKLVADIAGDFGDIMINVENAALDFDGTARAFAMQGHRAAVQLNFASDMSRDAIALKVDSLISRISFGGSGRDAYSAFRAATAAITASLNPGLSPRTGAIRH